MPKTYKTCEVMKMLTENPKLKFVTNNGFEYTMSVDGGYFYFEVFDNNGEYVNPEKYAGGRFNGNVEPNLVWTLVQEPVPFMEAAKAYHEGKAIRCEIECKAFTYKKSKYNEWLSMEAICGKAKYLGVSVKEILYGRWYIEE